VPRPGPALLLLVLVAVPLASAQGVPPGTPLDPVQNPLRLAAGADIADVRPNSGFGLTNLSVQVHCTALSVQDPTTVDLVVEGAPAYFTVTVTPASVVFPPNQPVPTTPPTPPCANEFRVQDAYLFVAATGDAPADVPGMLTVTGKIAGTDKTAATFLNVSASAYTAIDLSSEETSGKAEPGNPWTFDVTVRNRANAMAEVELVGGSPHGIKVKLAGGQVGSTQAGDPANTAAFPVEVSVDASVVNGRYPIWVNATTSAVGKPNVRGDRDSLQLSLVVSGGALPPGEEENGLPAAALAAPVALALAAATARRRR
ncbi:MAG TPA: hypothetical protein VI997_11540, partial [Candidatus Thermoplasmatota archaeon]|nr:hypothetical protein [Candidatus Thermoplasmatota archaeon]